MKKALIMLSILIILLGLIYFLWPQLWFSVLVRTMPSYSCSQNPNLCVIPSIRNLSVDSDSMVKGQDVVISNLRLRVPWQGTVTKKEANHSLTLSFPGQDNALIYVINAVDVLEEIKKYSEKDFEQLEEFFGPSITGSSFEFSRAVLYTSPRQITPFISVKEIMAKSILVTLKYMITLGEGPFYEFSINDIRGFQFQDPEVSGGVFIEFFDREGKEYEFIINGTQEEIDFILSSITFASQ